MENLLEMPRSASHSLAPGQDGALRWHAVCRLGELEDSWGETALVDGRQVALFRVGRTEVFAVTQADPATQAHVMT